VPIFLRGAADGAIERITAAVAAGLDRVVVGMDLIVCW
jgi:hypothetical protein